MVVNEIWVIESLADKMKPILHRGAADYIAAVGIEF